MTVKTFVIRVAGDSWEYRGITGELWEKAAALLPFGTFDELSTRNHKGQIIFCLPLCRRFSDRALIGIVAHEFAHAVRAAALDSEWHEKMLERREIEETDADRLATEWGFGPCVQQLRDEWTAVGQWLDVNSARILRQIRDREQKVEQAVKQRFEPERIRQGREVE